MCVEVPWFKVLSPFGNLSVFIFLLETLQYAVFGFHMSHVKRLGAAASSHLGSTCCFSLLFKGLLPHNLLTIHKISVCVSLFLCLPTPPTQS